MFSQIVLASNNAGKLREFSALFADMNVQLLPQSQFSMPECPEPHPTFVENALAKARHASFHSRLPALADDSGICINALDGAPGVLSARYADGGDAGNNAKVCAKMAGQSDTACYYVCVLALVRHPSDPAPLLAQGIWHGHWRQEASGEHGFGYDPHFFLPEYGKTAADMPPEQKNTVSHRARAWRQLSAQVRAMMMPLHQAAG